MAENVAEIDSTIKAFDNLISSVSNAYRQHNLVVVLRHFEFLLPLFKNRKIEITTLIRLNVEIFRLSALLEAFINDRQVDDIESETMTEEILQVSLRIAKIFHRYFEPKLMNQTDSRQLRSPGNPLVSRPFSSYDESMAPTSLPL